MLRDAPTLALLLDDLMRGEWNQAQASLNEVADPVAYWILERVFLSSDTLPNTTTRLIHGLRSTLDPMRLYVRSELPEGQGEEVFRWPKDKRLFVHEVLNFLSDRGVAWVLENRTILLMTKPQAKKCWAKWAQPR